MKRSGVATLTAVGGLAILGMAAADVGTDLATSRPAYAIVDADVSTRLGVDYAVFAAGKRLAPLSAGIGAAAAADERTIVSASRSSGPRIREVVKGAEGPQVLVLAPPSQAAPEPAAGSSPTAKPAAVTKTSTAGPAPTATTTTVASAPGTSGGVAGGAVLPTPAAVGTPSRTPSGTPAGTPSGTPPGNGGGSSGGGNSGGGTGTGSTGNGGGTATGSGNGNGGGTSGGGNGNGGGTSSGGNGNGGTNGGGGKR